MISAILTLALLSCTPDPTMICTREMNPVCADGTDYANPCMARAAGFVGECASKVTPGTCSGSRQILPSCGPTETFSETGACVPKPWSDYVSCIEEKNQGACPEGYDPNPWVGVHCSLTCAN